MVERENVSIPKFSKNGLTATVSPAEEVLKRLIKLEEFYKQKIAGLNERVSLDSSRSIPKVPRGVRRK